MYQSKVSNFSQSKLPPFGISQISHHVSHMNASIAPGFTNTQCPSHPEYVITNICRAPSCIEPLCPQCIPAHIQLHQQTKQPSKIQTIVAARVQCIQRLAQQKFYLESDLEKINKQFFTDPEVVAADLKTKLANSKSKLIKMIDKIFDHMNEQVEVIYSAYCNEADKNSLQARKTATPLSQHLQYIVQQKQVLQSDDYISSLIQLLTQFPKKPEHRPIKKTPSFGSVQVNPKMLEEVHKAIQKYVNVIVNCKQQTNTNTKLMNIKSNNSKFSRQSAQRSRITERSRSRQRSIFQSKVLSPSTKDLAFESYYNEPGYKVFYESNRSTNIQITQPDYFQSNGLLAYFEDNSRVLNTVNINYIEQGFSRKDLKINFLIPAEHRSLVTPQGDILIFGGKINESIINSVYIVNSDMLLELPSMNSERYNFGICYHDEYVYVAGGLQPYPTNKFQRFSIKKRCWTVLKPCIEANYACQLTAFNHFIVKIGGKTTNGNINSIQLYNIQSDCWSNILLDSSFHLPSGCGLSQITSNEILVFGGFIDQIKTNEVFVIRFNGNQITIQKSIQIYSDSSFINPTYLHRRSILSLQNTTKGTGKNIIKFNGSNWKFVSC